MPDPQGDCSDTDHWRSFDPPLHQRSGSSVAVLPDGSILVSGGWLYNDDSMTYGTPYADRFDLSTGTWSTLPDLPDGRFQHQILPLDDGGFLLVGGYGEQPGEALSSTVRFDPETEQWSSGPELPVPLAPAASVVHTELRVVAGQGGVFMLDDGQWRTLAEPQGIVAPDALFPWGDGLVAVTYSQRFAEIYDPAADVWTSAPSEIVPHSSWNATLSYELLGAGLSEPEELLILGVVGGGHPEVDPQRVVVGLSLGAGQWLGAGVSPHLSPHPRTLSLDPGRVWFHDHGPHGYIYDAREDQWCRAASASTDVHGRPLVLEDGSIFYAGGSGPQQLPYLWVPD